MKKVIIIGSPGAGKSVFSNKLKKITNLPLYHLDTIFYKKDGTHVSTEEFIEELKKIFKKDAWILDGNYQRTLELRLKECDTVFLLDFPTEICLQGAESRLGKQRDDIPWFENELNKEFKNKIVKFSNEKLPKIYELLNQYKESINIIIFKNRTEADNYIKNYINKWKNNLFRIFKQLL